jgi:tetratricopeptide (TPR) repeat protein
MKRAYFVWLTSALGAAPLRLNISLAMMTVLSLSIGTTVAFGQASSYGDLSYRCNVINVNERTSALGGAQWSRLIQLAIAYRDNCQDVSTREQKATAYLDIGIGANGQGNFLYAVEVLKGWARLLPSYAPCHSEAGRAQAALGKVQEERESLKKAITSGGWPAQAPLGRGL